MSADIKDITKVLEDSQALTDIAISCRITVAQARAVAAAIGNLSSEQASRLCNTAAAERVRQANREARKR